MSRDVWVWAIAVAVLISSASVRAEAPKPALTVEAKREASTHFRRGVELYGEGAYRAALIELKRAHEVAPDYRVLYNIGQTHYALGEYVEAIPALETYLSQGGSEIAAARRDEVATVLVELSKRVATLRITTEQDGVAITIDGVAAGTTPLSVSVSVGRHTIAGEAEDGSTGSETIDVAGGDQRTVGLTLLAPLVTAPAPAPVVTQEPTFWGKLSTRDRWGYGLLTSGVAVAIGGAVFAGLAKKADSDASDALHAQPGNAAKIHAAQDDLKRNSIVADALFGTAIVAGVTGLVLVLVREPKPEKKLEVGVGFQSIVAKGKF